MGNVETITHTKFFLKPFMLNKNSSGEIHSALAFQTSLRLEGMSEIQANRFSLDTFSPFCVINQKNDLIANDFHRYRYYLY